MLAENGWRGTKSMGLKMKSMVIAFELDAFPEYFKI